MKVTTQRATLADAQEAMAAMSPGDLALVAAGGAPGEAGSLLPRLVDGSAEAWAVRFDGEIAVVWGVLPAVPGAGYLWMLPAALTHRRPKTFLTWARGALDGLRGRWRELHTFVEEEHRDGLRWAERLGVVFGQPEPFAGASVCRATLKEAAACRP